MSRQPASTSSAPLAHVRNTEEAAGVEALECALPPSTSGERDASPATSIPPSRDTSDSPDKALSDLLDETRSFLERYVVFAMPEQSYAVALWVAHTHIFEQFETTPYLAVTSAEKQSGKTRLLDVLEILVARPWRAILPSEAVLYRKVSKDWPTLLLDEVDAIYGKRAREHESLRALLNAGHRKNTKVPRCVKHGSKVVVEEFEVYCPKALAGIGELPDTIADRSIPIRLVRRTRNEAVARFRQREAEEKARPIRDGLAAWAAQIDLSGARPTVPEELDDRAADGWESLIAIADSANKAWSELSRRAAITLHASEGELERSLGVQLLRDVAEVFDRSGQHAIFSKDLTECLNDLEESPWGGFAERKGLIPRGLARMLLPYGIRPRSVRVRKATGKGYTRADFEDVWARYVSRPPFPGSGASHGDNGGNSGGYADSGSSRPDPSVTDNPELVQ